MSLNENQQKAVDCQDSRIICLAGAGSGKTFTLISRISKQVQEGVNPDSILALTFTNAAGLEMKERFKKENPGKRCPEFRTFHAFCYSLICKDRYVREALGYEIPPTIVEEVHIKKLEKQVKTKLGTKLSDKKLSSTDKLNDPKEEFERITYQKALKNLIKKENVITFDMLCYNTSELFVNNESCTLPYKRQYKYIYCDEVQDTDMKQFKFLSSFTNSNFFLVGDIYQCQPAGTSVRMADGSEKNIEDIKIGDNLVGYNAKHGYYSAGLNRPGSRPNSVIQVQTRDANNVLQICTESGNTRMTPDHITYAKFEVAGNEDITIVYLMTNDKGWWRIGECKFYTSNGNGFMPRTRMHQEGGSAIWLLKVCRNKKESWLTEQLLAYKYGIPQTTWESCNCRYSSQADLDGLYENLPFLHQAAEKLLSDFGRDINYPFLTIESSRTHFSKLHVFTVRGCNILPDIMSLPMAPRSDARGRTSHSSFAKITDVRNLGPSKVYSLDVQPLHNYIADGFLTHNCIYQFRGTTSEPIKALINSGDWTIIKLLDNYRSTTQICEYANRFTSKYGDDAWRIPMEGHRGGEKVTTEYGSYSTYSSPLDRDHMSTVLDRILQSKDSGEYTAVLCRSNREVSQMKTYLTDAGIAITTQKPDEDLINILKSVNDNEYFQDWLASFLPEQTYGEYIKLLELIENPTIKWFADTYRNIPEINDRGKKVTNIRRITRDKSVELKFKFELILKELRLQPLDEECYPENESELFQCVEDVVNTLTKTSVYVGTVHSSKGLEYDTVHVMGVDDKLFELTTEEMKNLFYVACTRAKNRLYIYRR